MNDRPNIPPPASGGRGNWLDTYVADTQVVPSYREPAQQLVNIAAIRGLIFRQRWLVSAVVLAALVAGLIFTLLATPMYEARSTVRIEPYGSFIIEGQDVSQGIASNQVYEMMATQVGIITSRRLADTVAAELNLGERYDFLGEDIDEGRPPNLLDEDWIRAKEGIAAGMLHGAVSSEVPTSNWIISIAFRSDDPAIAAEMANAYAEAFAASDTSATLAENEYAKEYLREQIDVTRAKLQEAEETANAYARSSGIIIQQGTPDDLGGSATLTSSNLTRINARAAAATATRIAAEQRWRSIQNLPAGQLPAVQTNPVLQTLVTDRTAKRAELADLRQRYNDEFPQITNLQAQIATLDQQINKSSADIKATVRNEFTVARNQEQALLQELDSQTNVTLAEQDRQVEYSVLEREAQVLRDQLQAVLTRYNQVSTATNVQTGRINPLDKAVVPGAPYAPSLAQNMGLALVLGIALAGGIAVLRETLDDRIRSLEEIEERLALPLLGQTPYVVSRDIAGEGTSRFSTLVEAYASIRSTIDFSMSRERNVLQFTSSQDSEGKSTTVVILAELFASMGRKTLLIDADLRRPSVAALLGLEKPKVGFVEVLLGHTDLQSAVIKGVHENLEILPIAEPPTNPTELLASSQLSDFIEEWRQEYSLIIFDSCPVLGLADAPMLSRQCDGTVFVIEANRVHVGQAKSAIRRLQSTGGNIIGAVLTKYRALEAGQSYDYGYNYYRYGSDQND